MEKGKDLSYILGNNIIMLFYFAERTFRVDVSNLRENHKAH